MYLWGGSVNLKVFGFFWEKQYSWKKKKGTWETNELSFFSSYLHSHRLASNIVNSYMPKAAKAIAEYNELEDGSLREDLKKCVPYRSIRETILDYTKTLKPTKRSMDLIRKIDYDISIGDRDTRQLYFVTMDSDAKQLSPTERSFFNIHQAIIDKFQKENMGFPDVVSMGYSLDHTAPELSSIAVDGDRKVRCAITRFIGNGSYYPEPCGIYQIQRTTGIFKRFYKNFARLTFKAGKESTNEDLESRRLIENGIDIGIFDPNKFCFDDIFGSLVTATSLRMETKKAKKYKELTRSLLLSSDLLLALRNISQVHFNPRDWARYVYEGITKEIGKGNRNKIISPLTNIFKFFDFIEFITTKTFQNKKSFEIYYNFLEICADKLIPTIKDEIEVLSDDMANLCSDKPKNMAALYKKHGSDFRADFAEMKKLLKQFLDFRKELRSTWHLSKDAVDRVTLAAIESGRALAGVIEKKYYSLPE